MQSLELQEIKASLLSLERTVKKLTEKSDAGLPDDVIDVDSLLSSFNSNQPPIESSGTLSLPPAFGSPPPLYSGGLTSPGYYPMITSFSSKQMRASSAPPTYRYFQQDYHGSSSDVFWRITILGVLDYLSWEVESHFHFQMHCLMK